MTRERAALVRLVLICAAWAFGDALSRGQSGLGIVLPAVLAIGAFVLTDGLGRATVRGEPRYWRGRRVDDDPPGGRWH